VAERIASKPIDAPKLPTASDATPMGSRVLKFERGFHWTDVVRRIYKQEGTGWQGVSRTPLVVGFPGATDQDLSSSSRPPFHLRYFEVEPGGFTSREKHAHEHVVVALRGLGSVELGSETAPLAFGDVVYVAPWEVHRFRCESDSEPFGFLCIVPAERDRPQSVSDD
jgi:ribulose-bisphosphate carboxylase large chain